MRDLAAATGVWDVTDDEIGSVRLQLEQLRFRVFALPPSIMDKASFVVAANATFPLDPPVLTPNWDGLTDALRNGFEACKDSRLAIVWPRATRMREHASEDYVIARHLLEETAETLASPEYTDGEPKQLISLIGH